MASTTHAFPLDTGHIMVASAGLWAPTIRHHKGRFYIICTNCTRGGEAFLTQNFYIYTDDIMSNEWSDPIFVDFKGIDPSLFFDIDDRVYFQGSWELTRERQPTCTIKQFEIDITTGKPLSETQEIWTGAAKYDTEGPHIYRKDGYYYLVVAEGGTLEHHMLSIARSRSIWGPFESYEYNPILTSDLKNEFVQNTGHGELFHDASGAWWAVVLGVRESEGGRSPIGRESFLTPVDWPKGGWPTIDQPRMTFTRFAIVKPLG
ncbi:xylosidase/arabinosidase [Aureobasidium pullulans]|nr:xylosidase/arabinosidase [Aureobasidium pullulans]